MTKDKFLDALYGFHVGDMIGVPYEFMDSYEIGEIKPREYYGAHEQPMGSWSDDTSMLLATLDAVNNFNGDINDLVANIGQNFIDWRYSAKYTSHGVVFDIGRTTSNAISKMTTKLDKYEYVNCGYGGELDSGNGSLMRILPLILLKNKLDYSKFCELVDKASSLTHSNDMCKYLCRCYLDIVHLISNGMEKCHIRDILYEDILREYQITEKSRRFGSGYVLHTIHSAVACFLEGDDYESCVKTAIRLGNDTDTIGALCGALAGLYYGRKTIPESWLNSMVFTNEYKEIVTNIR